MTLEKFSKVSALVYLVHKVTIYRTFKKPHFGRRTRVVSKMPACVGVTLKFTHILTHSCAHTLFADGAIEMSEYLNTREKAVRCLMLSFHPVPVAR
jgi:hypothetical protein